MKQWQAWVPVFALLAAIAAYQGTVLANDDVLARARDATQWGLQTGDYANTRYSALEQITSRNARQLRVAWSFSTGVLRGYEGGPLVVDGIMYVHTPFPNLVYALDLDDDGRILWKYEPKQDNSVIGMLCCDTVNRGPAYADGKLFLAQADTTVVALDAKTGKLVWSAANGNSKMGETNTTTVLPVKDKVIVGNSGSELGTRGHVTAYDMKSGRRLWRAYSSGPDDDVLIDPATTMSLGQPVGKDSSLKTWNGDQWKIGGGTTWGWYSYDPKLDLFYYGTGNPGTWNPVQRAGSDGNRIDLKWTSSIFARNPDTGVAKWIYQVTPFDEWDFDAVSENILVDITVAGAERAALVHFDKNGIAYTLDRATGEPLVAAKYDPTVNWTDGVVLDKSRAEYGRPTIVSKYSPFASGEDSITEGICPAVLGAKDPQPAAYSPATGLFYVPTNHICMDLEVYRVSYVAGQLYLGASLHEYPALNSHGGGGNFIAWDASQGRIIWSKPERFAVWSGALATAGGIVCYGTLEGYFKCLDQTDGTELYKLKTPSGIVGNVMSYMHKGKQYLAVYSGLGGWAGVGLAAGLISPIEGMETAVIRDYSNLGGTVTVFALP